MTINKKFTKFLKGEVNKTHKTFYSKMEEV